MRLICSVFSLCLLLIFCTQCREDKIKVYHGANYIHFTTSDGNSPQITFNFATQSPLYEEADIPLPLSLIGYLLKENTPLYFSVVDGEKSNIKNPNLKGFFRKGVPQDSFLLKVRRNEDLLKTNYRLTLRLDSAYRCLIGPKMYDQIKIHVVDSVAKPVWWEQSAATKLGAYTPIKYRLLIIFMRGEILETLNKYSGIEFQELIARFKAWWVERWKEGNYHYYDTDGKTPLYETIDD